MAQTTQIVPKFSFPYAETVINDYTQVSDDVITEAVTSTVKQVYAVTASKGIDNTWVKKSSRVSAVKTFGDSNFAKYGQPLMQALAVLENDDTEVFMMRVMPTNATYSNAIVTAAFKADDTSIAPSARKFRIKLTSDSYENISTDAAHKANLDIDNGTIDAEGFKKVPFMAVRYTGRGTCGDKFSSRISQASTYEKEYGIKLYDFEIMNYETGLIKDSDYVGSLVTSLKYNDSTVTQINDLLADTEIGLAPVDVYVLEDRVSTVYEAYVEFVKSLNIDLEAEYETKLAEYNIPADQLDGTVKPESQYVEKIAELKKIEALIEDTTEDNIPDEDEFDIIFGRKVGLADLLPGIEFVKTLTPDVDTTAPDYVAADYTADTNVVDFSSAKGLVLKNGTNGYFDNPRVSYEAEVEECLNNAFNGEYDAKILSDKRLPLTIIFDANYPFSVKQTLADLALTRNACPVRFDVGIIDSLSISEVVTLITKYASFNDKLESIDIHNYEMKDPATKKHCKVTINYLLASRFNQHYLSNGYHIPFVKEITQLSGHIRDSLRPVIEDYNVDIKEKLYDNRFNYYECIRENVFWRSVQNTRQEATTDLLEESNVLILYTLKNEVEIDIMGQLYNFAEDAVRTAFVNYENAKYANWNSRIVQSIDFSFATSEYEFEHSILHLYVAVVFRGLTKRVIVEIDINKRQMNTDTTETV